MAGKGRDGKGMDGKGRGGKGRPERGSGRRGKDLNALRRQHGDQPDQRQADQGAGVITDQAVEEGDAQPLGLEAASTIEGALAIDVAGDLRRGQGAELDPDTARPEARLSWAMARARSPGLPRISSSTQAT